MTINTKAYRDTESLTAYKALRREYKASTMDEKVNALRREAEYYNREAQNFPVDTVHRCRYLEASARVRLLAAAADMRIAEAMKIKNETKNA